MTLHKTLSKRTILKLLTALGFAFAALLLLFGSAGAQDGQPSFPTDNDVNAVAKKLYCPVCPNTPLDVCETKACVDWRAQIKDQLGSGWSEAQVIDYFVAQYGERVLAEPQRRGFTSFVWILPVLIVVIGIVVVWQVLSSWRAARSEHLTPPAPRYQAPPEVLAKIEKELRELDG